MRTCGLLGLVTVLLCGCGGGDDGGDGSGGASGSSAGTGGGGGASGTGGAQTRGGAGSASSDPRAAACEALCDRGVTCGADRAQCVADCARIVAVSACAAQVDALFGCQEGASGSCEDAELVVEGCDAEGLAAASCLMGAGFVPGGGGEGGGGSGGSSAGDATTVIKERCEALCDACEADDPECVTTCRFTGASNPQCEAEYVGYLQCATCASLSRPAESCTAELDALRACMVPVPPSTPLSCTQACDMRAEADCARDVRRDICSDTCDAAEAKPECAAQVTAYASCASSSRNLCLPHGELSTECVPEIQALQECADLGSLLVACSACVEPALAAGGACFAALDACGDGFMDCTVERVCLEDCLRFSRVDPSALQTLESCASRCGAGLGAADPLGFRAVVECVACACTAECAMQEATCN